MAIGVARSYGSRMTTTTGSLARMIQASHRHADHLLPDVPVIEGLECQDHATFVAAADQEQAFRAYWAERGMGAMDPLVPTRYPARHIAFAADPDHVVACQDMIGLSVSDDPRSPINHALRLHGGWRVDERGEFAVGRLQHVALAVRPGFAIEDVRGQLEALGVRFMTPVLTFADGNGSGAFLQQTFVACQVPYGPFVEIVKRGEGPNGEVFQGFNADQIDELYRHYDAYSRGGCR